MIILSDKVKENMISILKRHGVLRAAIFGSFARNNANENSDIDILVELPHTKSLFDLSSIRIELREELGINVDVLTFDGVNPKLRDIIFNEKVDIL